MQTGRFTKAQRIRRRPEFQNVFDTGVRVQGRYLTLLMAPTAGPRCRLGIIASKKLGSAVARNRAKRLIREIFRQYPPRTGRAVDVLVIPRRDVFDATPSSFRDDFRGACRRAGARLSAGQ